jgi:hypothetical protein
VNQLDRTLESFDQALAAAENNKHRSGEPVRNVATPTWDVDKEIRDLMVAAALERTKRARFDAFDSLRELRAEVGKDCFEEEYERVRPKVCRALTLHDGIDNENDWKERCARLDGALRVHEVE